MFLGWEFREWRLYKTRILSSYWFPIIEIGNYSITKGAVFTFTINRCLLMVRRREKVSLYLIGVFHWNVKRKWIPSVSASLGKERNRRAKDISSIWISRRKYVSIATLLSYLCCSLSCYIIPADLCPKSTNNCLDCLSIPFISQFNSKMKICAFLIPVDCQCQSPRNFFYCLTYLLSIGSVCWISSESIIEIDSVDFIAVSCWGIQFGNGLVVEAMCSSSSFGDSSLLYVVDDKQRVSLRSTCIIHMHQEKFFVLVIRWRKGGEEKKKKEKESRRKIT